MFINADFGISGLTDLEYRFYDILNAGLGEWLSTGIAELTEAGVGTGLYTVNVDVPDNALTYRFRRTTNHTVLVLGNVATPRIIKHPRGLYQVSNNEFLYRWDTRNSLNGDALIEAFALGSDGLWATADITVNITNELGNNIIYKEYTHTLHRDNYEYVKPHFGIESYELSVNPLRRGWLQVGVRTEGSALPANPTPEESEAWWKQFTILPLESGTMWKRVPDISKESGFRLEPTDNILEAHKTQWSNNSTLEEPNQTVWYGIRISPYETMRGYNLNADKVLKIREYVKGEYSILTQGPSLLWSYDGTRLDNLISFGDFSETGFNVDDVLDAAYSKDKVYCITSDNKLAVIDLSPDEKHSLIIPVGESKPLKFLEVSGGTTRSTSEETLSDTGEVIAIYSDATSTTAYGLNDLRKLWEVSFSVDRIYTANKAMWIVDNATLYKIDEGGLAEPVVSAASSIANAFPSNIKYVNDSVVLTEAGYIYINITEGSWVPITMVPQPNATSVALARVGEEYVRAFLGMNNDRILEYYNDNRMNDSRYLQVTGVPQTDYSKTSNLWHYEDEISPAKGTAGGADYEPAVYDDRLLITTNSPVGQEKAKLVVLQKSTLSSDKAVLVSKVNKPNIFPEEIRLNRVSIS